MTADELTSIVRRVEPAIRAGMAEGERDRRVPKQTFEALRGAGLLRTWTPKSLGGWALEPVTACRMFEDLAAIDAAAGWLVQMSSAISLLGAWFGDAGIASLYETPGPVFADSFSPAMRVVPVRGGFEVTGQAAFSSNCQHADWFLGLGFEFAGDQPRLGANGKPDAMVFAVPRGQFEVVDHWNTVGMRGTGSHDVRVPGVFVPNERFAAWQPISEPRNRAYREAPSLGAIWLGLTSTAAIGLGVARAATDAFLALCDAKTPSYMPAKLADMPLTHYRMGEAHARLGAARAYLYETLAAKHEQVTSGAPLRVADRADLAAAGTFAMQSAESVIALLGESATTSTVRDEHPLSRHARDLHTLTKHVFTSRNRYQDVGAMRLGRAPIFEMLSF